MGSHRDPWVEYAAGQRDAGLMGTKKHEKATLMNTPGASDGKAPTVPIGE